MVNSCGARLRPTRGRRLLADLCSSIRARLRHLEKYGATHSNRQRLMAIFRLLARTAGGVPRSLREAYVSRALSCEGVIAAVCVAVNA